MSSSKSTAKYVYVDGVWLWLVELYMCVCVSVLLPPSLMPASPSTSRSMGGMELIRSFGELFVNESEYTILYTFERGWKGEEG